MTDPITGRSLTSTWIIRQNPADSGTTMQSAMAGVQARYFSNRLIFNAGIRTDLYQAVDPVIARDPATNIQMADYANGEKIDFRGNTKTVGAVGHLSRTLSLLANYSTNLGLPPARATVTGGFDAPPRTGEGKDIGIALSLLGGRLYSRIVYYETAGTNLTSARGSQAIGSGADRILEALVGAGLITQAESNAPGRRTNGATVTIYDMASDGYEFQVTANATNRWPQRADSPISAGPMENGWAHR